MSPRPRHHLPLVLVALLVACNAGPLAREPLDTGDTHADDLEPGDDFRDATDTDDTGADTDTPDDLTDRDATDTTAPDPCLAMPGACQQLGRTCRGDALVDCGPSTDGCAIETLFDCTIDGGRCDDEGTGARCTDGDPCFARPNACDAVERTCLDDTLIVCAPDALGCLVETRTDCAIDGFTCLADAEPVVCSGGERCMNLPNACTQAARTCDEDQLVVCARDASGCLVETVTDCAASDLMCRTQPGTLTSCGPPCHEPVCLERESGERTCSVNGNQVIECVDADGDRCLEAQPVEDCGADSCAIGVGGAPSCPDVCGDDTLGRLSCATPSISSDTAAGSLRFDGLGCTSASYTGREALFGFVDAAAARVTVTASWTAPLDYDLFVYAATQCDDDAACLAAGAAIGPTPPEQVTFDVAAGELVLLALDVFTGDGMNGTSPFTLDITCERPVCGDGLLGPGEACDDQGTAPGDGCNAACQVEPGHVCAGEPSSCRAVVCGDGAIEAGLEACDDANAAPDDGCSECMIDKGFVCTGEPSKCTEVECGDGLLGAPLEACDDGNRVSGDGCSSACVVESAHQCTGEPSFCTSATGSGCGDPIVLPPATGQTFVFATVGGPTTWTDYQGTCATPPNGVTAAGSERTLAFDVPASTMVRATVTPMGGWDSVTVLSTACPSATDTCVDHADLAGAPEVVEWTNPSAQSRRVYLIVDGFGVGDAGEFTVELQ